MTKIYSRKGDLGLTTLANRETISKSHPRVAAYGDLDEATSALGVARAFLSPQQHAVILEETMLFSQRLYALAAQVAGSGDPRLPINEDDVRHLERAIDRAAAAAPDLHTFIIPGGVPGAALLQVARTVARRAERSVLGSDEAREVVGAQGLVFLNRVSDYLFVAAREVQALSGEPEVLIAP